MKVIAYYKDGSMEEYDTDSRFSDTNLFRTPGTCGVSCKLDLSNLQYGIYVEFWQHDLSDPVEIRVDPNDPSQKKNFKQVVSRIRYFGHDQVLDLNRLSAAKSVYANDKMVLYRVQENGKLVIWQRFTQLCELYLSSVDKLSYIEMAAQLFMLLKGFADDESQKMLRVPIVPRLNDNEPEDQWNRRIADIMGWDLGELLDIVDKRRELLQLSSREFESIVEIEDTDTLDD